MKTNKDLIIEPNAAIEGRKYSEEKPWSCKYCYWWGGKKKGCNLKQCHYLLPEKKKAVKTTPCGRMQRFSHESDHGTGRYYRGIEKQRSNGMGSPGKQCEKPGR